MQELKLIHSLFDQQVQFTLNYLASLQEKQWEKKLNPWDNLFFHKLTSDVDIAQVVKHTIIAEQHFINAIRLLKEGDIISLEGDETICAEKKGGCDIISCYRECHQENLNKIINLKQTELNKNLVFLNQSYSGVGILWMITGHHAFHLGQIRSLLLPPAS